MARNYRPRVPREYGVSAPSKKSQHSAAIMLIMYSSRPRAEVIEAAVASYKMSREVATQIYNQFHGLPRDDS